MFSSLNQTKFSIVAVDSVSVRAFIHEFNEAGGLNEQEDYESAVCFALERIFSMPNVET